MQTLTFGPVSGLSKFGTGPNPSLYPALPMSVLTPSARITSVTLVDTVEEHLKVGSNQPAKY